MGVAAVLFPQLAMYVRRSFLLDPAKMFRVSQAAEAGYQSVGLSFLASFFSVIFGPIPSTVAVQGRDVSAFYSPGLMFRYILSVPMLLGAIQVFKTKQKELYPLITFLFLEALALAVILRGFDLRFAYPHYPVLYLSTAMHMNKRDFSAGKQILVVAAGSLLLVVAFWFNVRLELISLSYQ
jgi:hypothetical protein